MNLLGDLFAMLVFPGFAFLSVFGLVAEYIDRKLYARLQNRVGPPWFQPLADFIKLLGKEDLIPEEAEPRIFSILPVIAVASVAAAFLYIPLWRTGSLFPFTGDVIVVLYLMTIPTLTFFLGGWHSTSLYSMIGAVRTLTQLFAYEVPLFMGILAPALLAGTWSLSGMIAYYQAHPWYWLINLPALAISLVALQGKLEKVPFDMAEAETEIVGGTFTEYSGRLLAFFRMAIDMEMIAGASLIAAVFMPFGLALPAFWGFLVYICKVIAVVCLLALFRTVVARLRIDQMVTFCWKYLAPAALAQILVNLVLEGILNR